MTPGGKAGGWTLIELVLAILLLSILAVGANLSLRGYTAAKLDGAARKLAADLALGQGLAMAKQVKSGVVLGANAYSVYEDYGASDLARDPKDGSDLIVDYTSSEYQDFSGVTLGSALPAGIVKFNTLGAPLRSDDTPIAAAEGKITLNLPGEARTLCIEPNTGKVRTLSGDVPCA